LPIDAAKALAKNTSKKMRLINLWSTTCGPCVAEFPALIDTYQRLQIRPFELITISIDPKKDAANVEAFLKKQHLPLSKRTVKSVRAEGRKTNNYHYQEDDLDALAKAIDPEWQGPIPHTLLIAPGGKIVYRHTGQVDAIELRRAIIKAMEEPKMRKSTNSQSTVELPIHVIAAGINMDKTAVASNASFKLSFFPQETSNTRHTPG